MPRVPTILADAKLNAPYFSGGASESQFAPDTSNVSRSLNVASAGLENLAGAVSDLERRRKAEDEERWLGDALHAEKSHLNEWQASTENNSTEDYAQKFKVYADSRIKEYEDNAPSKRTGAAFRREMQSFIEGRHHSALLTSERTRLENTKDSIISQTSLALETFRNSLLVPNVNSMDEVLGAHLEIRNRVEKIYGNLDPTLRRKMGAFVDAEFAMGIASHEPAMAKSIVTDSTDLEETAKAILLNKIEAADNIAKSAGRDEFNKSREDAIIQARDGKRSTPLSLAEYQRFYDDDTSKRLKADDDMKFRIYGDVNKKFSELAPKAAQHQTAEVNALGGKINSKEDDLKYNLLREKLIAVQQLQAQDPVAYLSQYNPEVTEAMKIADSATGEGKVAALTRRAATILKFQGVAPEGAKDAEMYLGAPILARKLMSGAELRKNRDFINQGTPQEALKKIEQVLATYPGHDNQDIAFNDLARDPGGIRQEYRLAWQNKDQWWVQTFLASLQDEKAIHSLTDERKGALGKELDGDPTWIAFKKSQIGVNPANADQIEGFRQGIMTYANYFSSSQGMGMKDAVRQSIKHLLDSTMGQTTMNGRPMFIVREQPGKPPRTDDEIADVGRRLAVALKDVDPRSLDQSKFPVFAGINPKEDNIDRLQALRDHITRSGFFHPTQDGQAMILYTTGDSGIPFEVRDKQGRALMIRLEDLPVFRDPSLVFELDPTKSKLITKTVEDPKGRPQTANKTYPLQEFSPSAGILDKTLWYWGGIYNKQTHWPTNSGYWNRKAQESQRVGPSLENPPIRLRDTGPKLIKPQY
jgi:hypothetical protein